MTVAAAGRISYAMPLKPGTSQKTVSKNISEHSKGKQHAATAAKHGEAVAHKQDIAIAMDKKRESMSARTVAITQREMDMNSPEHQRQRVTIRRLTK